MPRSKTGSADRDTAALRAELAGIAVAVRFARLEATLARKYRSDQPRAPAGQPDGGRWVSDGPAASRVDESVTADGSRVLSIRIRANPRADWEERHTVTAPDGARTVFETSGLTQTIRDGETGEVLGRTTLTADGALPEASVQPVRGAPGGLAKQIRRTLEAAGTLFSVLAGRNSDGRKAVFAAPASEYVPGDAFNERAVWVGAISQSELDRICPRNREVQALANSVAAEVRASGNYVGEQDFGNKVHKEIEIIINAQKDPKFIAESSYRTNIIDIDLYGARGYIKLDVLEQTEVATVCVYDHKTGKSGLRATRAVDIMTTVQKNFPGTLRYIMIEVRPEP